MEEGGHQGEPSNPEEQPAEHVGRIVRGYKASRDHGMPATKIAGRMAAANRNSCESGKLNASKTKPPKNTTAVVACPLGNEYPNSW